MSPEYEIQDGKEILKLSDAEMKYVFGYQFIQWVKHRRIIEEIKYSYPPRQILKAVQAYGIREQNQSTSIRDRSYLAKLNGFITQTDYDALLKEPWWEEINEKFKGISGARELKDVISPYIIGAKTK